MRRNSIKLAKGVVAKEPLPHLTFVGLLKYCRFVISDSGGIQEEASFFDRPCLVLRNETEWTRLIKIKKNFLFPKIGIIEKN
jgi:UDP-GlcNAc3NAcA epimerase